MCSRLDESTDSIIFVECTVLVAVNYTWYITYCILCSVHLFDDYQRCRVKHYVLDKEKREFKETDWCLPEYGHPHFKALKNISIKTPEGETPVFYNDLAASYVYVHRIYMFPECF